MHKVETFQKKKLTNVHGIIKIYLQFCIYRATPGRLFSHCVVIMHQMAAVLQGARWAFTSSLASERSRDITFTALVP